MCSRRSSRRSSYLLCLYRCQPHFLGPSEKPILVILENAILENGSFLKVSPNFVILILILAIREWRAFILENESIHDSFAIHDSFKNGDES